MLDYSLLSNLLCCPSITHCVFRQSLMLNVLDDYPITAAFLCSRIDPHYRQFLPPKFNR